MKPSINLLFCICLLAAAAIPQSGMGQDTDLPTPWVSYPSANNTAYGVYHFRKTFDLATVPKSLAVHISADNRYELFVNGSRVCFGPAKGDLITYKYDIIDLAPFLKPGKNLLAVLVFNLGQDKPMAFISAQTAFLFRSEAPAFAFLNSDQNWKVYQNPAYDPIGYRELKHWEWVKGYYACGPGDEMFADRYPWGWEQPGFDDSGWRAPEILAFENAPPWKLVPRNIPFMDTHPEKPGRIRKTTGVEVPAGFLEGKTRFTIPADRKATVLFDYDRFTMGYPELTVDKGAGSSIKIRYAEALYTEPNVKAHRDSVNGLTMYGVFDIFHPDGQLRTFRPLWKRAFRYIELEIETGNQPLELVALQSQYSGYPYPDMGTFHSNDPRLNAIFETGLRTLRMCSGETYYDTPYYEQLCYGGDNRPISAISLYNSTDDRLFREAMRLYPQSANRETRLFKSAYPSRFDFDMGTWSLAWIQSLWDYYTVRGDSAFVSQFAQPIEEVLDFFQRSLDESTGLLGPMRTQNFIDWSIDRGSLPYNVVPWEKGQSAILSLYFALSLDSAAQLFRHTGRMDRAEKWERISAGIKTAVYAHCWDADKGLMADYPDKSRYSQHTSILAILCDGVAPAMQSDLLDRLLSYPDFDEVASSYFSFFLFKAMQKTDREDLIVNHLGFWEHFLDRGHTTFGETGFPSHDRSDCHAWSAHPSYFLLSSVCGIKPGDIGFHTVVIQPHLGNLTELEAYMPHPLGRISVSYRKNGKSWSAEIELPEGMTGAFVYAGKRYLLRGGRERVRG